MEPIQAAIENIESREEGASFSYRKVADQFDLEHSTLRRRHQGLQATRATKALNQRKLNPRQEKELVRYIEGLTEQGLPPTREMIQNFASSVAESAVSKAWVSRFLTRNKTNLTSKWTTGIDRNRHKADTKDKYRLYFDLLHSKMREYDVDAEDVYNMDEKGFLIGITARSKRVFSKAVWERKERTAALQDGSREWITVIACVCADGEALPPAVIYEGKQGLQSSWLEDVEAGKHQVFFANSPSGWSNNDLGLAWLEQVFDRSTKKKARRRWRLLILDGHASHLTMDFINYCNANKILLAVFPPHSTHSLQPLDVVLFSPLSTSYSKELTLHLHRSQGLIGVKKGDFFPIFWAAWMSTFKEETVRKSFEATGIIPANADAILKRFKSTTSEQDKSPTLELEGDRSTWRQLRQLFDVAVKDTAATEAQRLSSSLHSLQVQNELLHHENEGLRDALTVKKKHKKKSKVLDLQQRQEYHGSAVFWSPRKVREARAREVVKQRDAELEKLQKTEARQLKEATTLYKKQQQEEAKAERQRVKETREKERATRAAELQASRASKQQEKDAANARKSLQLVQRGKRPASKQKIPKNRSKARVVEAASGEEAALAAPEPSPKVTTRGRSVRLPSKFK